MLSAARFVRATLALAFCLGTATPCLAGTTVAPVGAYAAALHATNPQLALAQCLSYAEMLVQYARKWRVDPSLVMALVATESHWNAHAVSPSGAEGLGQLLPGTARELGVQPFSARGNLRGTTLYLHRLMGAFRAARDPIREALAGYNAGPQAVRDSGGVPPTAESRHYVVKVMHTWHVLQRRIAVTSPARDVASVADPVGDLSYWGVR
jgi:soluble lytic murein transglycosylase-like protein